MKKLVLALLLSVALAACSAPKAALEHCRDSIAVNRGHLRDKALSADAKLVAESNLDAWCVQLNSLDGTPLPEDVGRRVAARRAAK